MLLDFSVKNFLSIRSTERISFVASNYDNDLSQNVIAADVPGMAGVKLLKALVLYGPNGGGKSNVLRALFYLQQLVVNSATVLNQGDPTGVTPFALDPKASAEPTEFIVRFIVDAVRYDFVLALDGKRIQYESLSAYPKGRAQVWYRRAWNDELQAYDWEPERPVDFRRDQSLVDFTRENALFLSTAAKWNNKQIEPIYRWFRDQKFLRLTGTGPTLSPLFTAQRMIEDPNARAEIVRMMVHADIGILSANANLRDMPTEAAGAPQLQSAAQPPPPKALEISFGHRGANGKEYPLDWVHQSEGTRKYFALAGPWLDILKNGFFAGLDEFEASMHPLMAVELLKLLFGGLSQTSHAQILFTTHNPLLLDLSLIRRDQVWFAEKDDEGSTHLYPLSNFKPRKDESLVRGYLSGRYGAVPFIPEGLLGQPDPAHAQ